MRTFVRIRQVLATNEELARKVSQHDRQIAVLFEQVQKMLAPVPGEEEPLRLRSAEGLNSVSSGFIPGYVPATSVM